MITKILGHELKQRFFHWTTLLFFLMLVFQGIWYTKGNFDYYVNEDLLMNSPSVFYKNLAGGGMLMIIIVAIITGTSLYKDLQYKTGQWIYTLPVNEKQFYLGRFLSAYLFNVFIGFGIVVGMLLVPYSGIGEAHRFGPTPIGQLMHGFVFLTMPNLFLLTALFFFALVFTRRMATGYLAILIIVVAFLVMQTVSEAGGITTGLVLADPFGYVGTEEMNNTLTGMEKNTAYLPISGNLMTNRLIWFTIALILSVLSYFKFNFKQFLGGNRKKRKTVALAQDLKRITVFNTKIGRPQLSFKTSDFWNKLRSLSVLEFKNVVRPVSFRIVLGIVLLMAVLQNLLWNASYYIGPTVPLTSTMTLFRLSFGVFIMILLMVWAGELFFKDRTVKIHHITDTLPVPVWVTQLSRFFAMVAVAFVLALSFMALGIVAQVLKGGGHLIEWGLYTYDILGYNWGWLTYMLWIALVFFISGLTGNRFLTHVLGVGLFFGTILAFELGLAEQTRFAFGAVPGLEDYSEISGYGIWKTSAIWYFFMWIVLALAFVLLGIYFWGRGSGRKWSKKLVFQGKQLSLGGKVAIVMALIGFFVLQSFMVKKVNGLGNFTFSAVEEKEAAEYETQYGYLKTMAHPNYKNLDLVFDFYPSERRAVYSAEILLANVSDDPVDTLFLNFKEHVTVTQVEIEGKDAELLFEDGTHHLRAYRLPEPMMPNDSLVFTLKAEKAYHGFTQSGSEPQPDLMYNGSFGSIREFLPVIGYDDDRELDENRKRTDQGLPAWESRMAKITDKKALKQHVYAPDAIRLTGNVTLGTSANQIPLAPGRLIKEWTENNRKYRTYHIQEQTPFNWCLGSGEYVDHVSKVKGASVHVLASPKHGFNIDRYQKALHASIAFVDQNLGGYPYGEVRLHEIPFYQDDFYAYANSIAISEKEGWYADTTNVAERAYIFQSTAAQIIKHWVQENIDIANVQGAHMLSKALPEALALQALEQEMGEEAFKHIKKKKLDFYGKEKNNEPNTEPPLLYSDGSDYLEAHKGAVALYELMGAIGVQEFNRFLVDWVKRSSSRPIVFLDLYKSMLDVVPMEQKEDSKKLFETLETIDR